MIARLMIEVNVFPNKCHGIFVRNLLEILHSEKYNYSGFRGAFTISFSQPDFINARDFCLAFYFCGCPEVQHLPF
jgi:hypothetical protein